MQVFARSIIARITLAFVALWLGAGVARAGGGGADAAGLQSTLDALCQALGMAPPGGACPQLQLPTASQLMLEIAALKTASPELVRFEGALPPPSPADVISAINPPAAPNLVPLAFISISGKSATVTEAGNPAANSLFTAAADEGSQMLNLTYDFSPAPSVAKGNQFATLSLPLVILNRNGSEIEAPTTITIQGATGSCKTTACVPVSAMATTQALGLVNVDPAKLGVTITASISANHLILNVQANLVVWSTLNPSYFVVDPVFGVSSVFFRNTAAPAPGGDPGFPSKLLASTQLGIGIAPYAGPLCPPNPDGTISRCVQNELASNYPYCANIGGQSAVAAFLSIGNFGETYVSAPLQPLSGVTCPF